MNRTNFEQVQYDSPSDVKPIITNLVHTYPHWHNEIEIVFACRGELLLEIGSRKMILKEGEIAVVNSTETHAVNTHKKETGEKNGDNNLLLMLQLSRQFMRNLYADSNKIRFCETITANEETEKTGLSLSNLLLCIMREAQADYENRPAVIHGLCGAVAAILIRYFSETDPVPDLKLPAGKRERSNHVKSEKDDEFDRNAERFKRILIFVNEHYAENPSLSDVARIAFVSPFYLSHLFTQGIGMSYSKYLNYIKVNMVRRDLAITQDTIIDIITRHGFTDTKNFYRVFKAQIGCSASEYRKSVRAGGAPLPLVAPLAEERPGNYVNYQSPVLIPRTPCHESKNNRTINEPGISAPLQAGDTRTITVKDRTYAKTLDRYFLKMTGQARSSDFLRKEVQKHFILAQREIGFEYVRFHGIFNDEMCLITNEGRYNWTYIDDVFDFLREIHLRPFIELSFMPSALASGDTTMFFYRGNVTPPLDWDEWGRLVEAFTKHLVTRYSLEEVEKWYFEVWNEPNIESYWTGGFDGYMRLYQVTASRVKSVSPSLKIGGPAVSSFNDHDARGFLTRFLALCAELKLPVDFVSAHPYPASYFVENGRLREILLGPDSTKNDMVWLRNLVSHSAYPAAEIHLDEWNTSARDRDIVHDTAFMAVFVLHNYLSCVDLTDSLCYWALSDRFEEHGLGGHEFHGGFGLLSVGGLKKPQYYAFEALKRLGNAVLVRGDDHIITCSYAGGDETAIAEIQALCWNYAHYNKMYAAGADEFAEPPVPDFFERYQVFERKRPLNFILNINAGIFGHCHSGVFEVEKTLFNRDSGSIFDFWLKNGAIENLSDEQRNLMSVQCVPKQTIAIQHAAGGPDGSLALSETVEPFGFVLFRIRPLSAV